MSNLADNETFTYWITHPKELETADLAKIEATTALYPYCQIGHILAAKCAANGMPVKLPALIQKAAAYAVNRYALKNLIHSQPSPSDDLLARLTERSLFKSKGVTPSLAEPPAVNKPVILTSDNEMIVNEAINQSLARMQSEKPEAETVKNQEDDQGRNDDQKKIIEKFIDVINSSGPNRIALDESDHFEDLSQRSQPTVSQEFATEALAQILARQGKIDKAIHIYQQLILKKPEKIDYFAEKIKELK